MSKLVISGVGLTSGGTLSVFNDCVRSAINSGSEVVLLVHNESLIDVGVGEERNCQILSYPWVKKRWIYRIYFEYFFCYFLAFRIRPKLWLSMHDMSTVLPRSLGIQQFVYCHNPSVFFRPRLKDFVFDFNFSLFCLFYRFLYWINIRSNRAVFVQQLWIAQAFREMFGADLPVVVQRPEINFGDIVAGNSVSDNKRFFYPTLPRTFKNIEFLIDVANIFSEYQDFEFVVTVDPTMGRYAQYLINKAGVNNRNIFFVGRLSRNNVLKYFEDGYCLVFPSLLETWGMPLTEAAQFGCPIYVADLPYAKETLAGYKYVNFFDPGDPQSFVAALEAKPAAVPLGVAGKPGSSSVRVLQGWDELIQFIRKSKS